MINAINSYLKESYEELRKVTWLSRQEVISSTIVIVILIAIVSVIVALLDFAFTTFIGWII